MQFGVLGTKKIGDLGENAERSVSKVEKKRVFYNMKPLEAFEVPSKENTTQTLIARVSFWIRLRTTSPFLIAA